MMLNILNGSGTNLCFRELWNVFKRGAMWTYGVIFNLVTIMGQGESFWNHTAVLMF